MNESPQSRQPINIVICSDGTGNTTIKGRGSNVFALYESVDITLPEGRERSQAALYDDGVGTQSLLPVRLWSAATGLGVWDKVERFYAELGRVYQAGDAIFLFGFSRGAYTVRVLSGFINSCGVPDLRNYANETAYRQEIADIFLRYRDLRLIADEAARQAARERLQAYCQQQGFSIGTPIRFVGVWDTVAAIGGPLGYFFNRNYDFSDYRPADNVELARHALALDDERKTFHPMLWQEQKDEQRSVELEPGKPATTFERLKQVWFSGVHSNVGGGYPRQGMAMAALEWMMEEARGAGLRLTPSEVAYTRSHADVHDKLYDSRGGFGVYYTYCPRNIATLCKAADTPIRVHASVFNRVRRGTEGYAPINLAPAEVQVRASTDTTEKLAPHSENLLERPWVRQLVRWRQEAYRLMLLSTLVAVLALLGLWRWSPSLLTVDVLALTVLLGAVGYGLGKLLEQLGRRRMHWHTPGANRRHWRWTLGIGRVFKRGGATAGVLAVLVLIVWAAGKISRHDSWTLLAVGAGGLALAYAIGAKARTELRRHASDWWHKQLKQAIATTPAQQAATGLPVEPPPPPAA